MNGLTEKSKDEFWAVVEECLTEIHNFDPLTAEQRCRELRHKIESKVIDKLQDPLRDIFYHSEPFDIACDIAQKHLNINNYRSKYNDILNRHSW